MSKILTPNSLPLTLHSLPSLDPSKRWKQMENEFKTVYWHDEKVRMIDQTKLPLEEVWLDFDDYKDVAESIRTMQVRGAPAIGVTAALGMALAAVKFGSDNKEDLLDHLSYFWELLAATRPTAVNLFWAIGRMNDFIWSKRNMDAKSLKKAIVSEAEAIQSEDISRNKALGSFGAGLIDDGDCILTHCNAGALACAGYGTALGVIRAAWESGKKIHVFVDETRPLLQGARLTAWELSREGIPMTLITDNMAGYMMQMGKVQKVVVGADRIAANGDVANKIGTYTVATIASVHKIPFIVAAPTSTIDVAIASGEMIPIEERSQEEIIGFNGINWAKDDTNVANPAFDVTPNHMVQAIVTERGILRDPFDESISDLFKEKTVP